MQVHLFDTPPPEWRYGQQILPAGLYSMIIGDRDVSVIVLGGQPFAFVVAPANVRSVLSQQRRRRRRGS